MRRLFQLDSMQLCGRLAVSISACAALSACLAALSAGCVAVMYDLDLSTRLAGRSDPLPLGASEVTIDGEGSLPLQMLFGLPTVTAVAADREITLLLDSGSQFCLISPQIVDALDLPVAGRMRLSLLGQTSESPITCLEDVAMGGVRCRNLPLVVSPGHLRRHILGFTIERIDGVLGMPFLRRCATTLDFPRGTVSFTPSASYSVPTGEGIYVVPIRSMRDGRLGAAVSLGGAEKHLFLLDSGAGRCVVRHDIARRIGLPDLGAVKLLSLGVEVNAHLTELPAFSLGRITVRNARAYVLPEAHSHMLRHVDGLIGIDVLKDFAVTIDPAGGKLVLIRGSGDRAPAAG